MANSIIDLAKLLVENPYGPTDYTIQLNEHKWKVHSTVLTQKSGHFAEILRDPFLGNKETITIKSGTPWLFARLIQWLYTGEFEYNAKYPMSAIRQKDCVSCGSFGINPQPIVPSLYQLVPNLSMASEFDDDNDFDPHRLEVHIDIAMAQLASDYRISRLITKAVVHLVLYLDMRSAEDRCRKEIAEMFPKIYQALEDPLRTDVWYVDRMVEILLAYKFASYKKETPYTTYITPNELTDRSPVVLGFQEHIYEYILKGGIFAVRLVHALENALQKSLQDLEWPPEVFVGDIAGETDFGGAPENYPADAGQPI